jgi:hypothetical protein
MIRLQQLFNKFIQLKIFDLQNSRYVIFETYRDQIEIRSYVDIEAPNGSVYGFMKIWFETHSFI